jgi:hypothetical protein
MGLNGSEAGLDKLTSICPEKIHDLQHALGGLSTILFKGIPHPLPFRFADLAEYAARPAATKKGLNLGFARSAKWDPAKAISLVFFAQD